MPTQTVFDEIRSGCRAVADRARHVRIDRSCIDRLAEQLPARPQRVPPLDTDTHYIGRPEDTVAYFLTLAAVNFGSGYFPHLEKRSGMSGYYTIAISLKERFERDGPLSAQHLAALRCADCAALFGQRTADPVVAELMDRFADAWNDLGRDLLSTYEGRFENLVRAAGHKAEQLVRRLVSQPFFRDVQRYHGRDVPFFKRSQLLASDLALALPGHAWGRFDDLDELTVFADNLVPHVLRCEGILAYAPALQAAIDTEQLIPAGSDEELEIRACSVQAVEWLVEATRTAAEPWTAREMDQWLWHRGQAVKTRGKRHRTRTVFY